MRHTTPYLLLVGLAAGCASSTASTPVSAPPAAPPAAAAPRDPAPVAAQPALPEAAPAGSERIDEGGAELFRQSAVEGTFVLLDEARGETTVINPELAGQRFLPCSTFKIPNTIIGLETGVIPDEHFSLRWDGKTRRIAEWNRDHDLASAMKHSVVWFYQEVARRIGQERMQRYVTAFGYGNHDISGGIDQFWLDGGLRISPREQVAFLRRLDRGELGVKPANVALLKKIITLDETPAYTLRGKTGTGDQDGKLVGWLVGEVEQGPRTGYYALLVRAPTSETDRVLPLRRALVTKILEREGWLSAAR